MTARATVRELRAGRCVLGVRDAAGDDFGNAPYVREEVLVVEGELAYDVTGVEVR